MKISIKFIVLIIMSQFAMACTSLQEKSNPIMSHSEHTKILGEQWSEGKEMVEKGNKLILLGNKQLDEGEDNLEKGREMLAEGQEKMQSSENEFQKLLLYKPDYQ